MNESQMHDKTKMRTGMQVLDGIIVEQTLRSFPDPDMKVYDVAYRSQGLIVHGCLVVPSHLQSAPGLLYCRGGIGKVGLVRPERLAQFARLGYVVFAPYYRGTNGTPGRDQFGGDDVYDVLNALQLLQSLPETDGQPPVLFGFSRGAIMALSAAKHIRKPGPVIVWGGVSDLWFTYEERVDLRRMLKRVVGHPQKAFQAYEQRSPVCWAEQIGTPVLIIHGTCDRQVSVEHASRLAYALSRAQADYELRLYAGQGHCFTSETDRAALKLVDQWINKYRQMKVH